MLIVIWITCALLSYDFIEALSSVLTRSDSRMTISVKQNGNEPNVCRSGKVDRAGGLGNE